MLNFLTQEVQPAAVGRIKVTASVTGSLVHAVVDSFLVWIRIHSRHSIQSTQIQEKLTAELHVLLKLHRRKRGD